MQNALSIIGWMMIGLAAAWAISARKKTGAGETGGEGQNAAAPDGENAGGDLFWCEAAEAVTQSAVLVINREFKVAAAGKRAAAFLGRAKETAAAGCHLMDAFSEASAPLVLDAVVAARRKNARTVRLKDGPGFAALSAAAKGKDVVIFVEEIP